MSEPKPGFKVTADELSDMDAWKAMLAAATSVQEAALARRQDLLHRGFSVDHQMCLELDLTASRWAESINLLWRQFREMAARRAK